jgi:hypothetical protein
MAIMPVNIAGLSTSGSIEDPSVWKHNGIGSSSKNVVAIGAGPASRAAAAFEARMLPGAIQSGVPEVLSGTWSCLQVGKYEV